MDEGRDKEPPASGPPQNSKFEWPLLFERASKNWWHPQFDSHILEQQYWKSLLPRTTKRFRFGLFYLAFMSGICCMYYGLMAVDEWLTFFLIFLLVFISVITILILTFVKEYFYRNHCFKISLSKYCTVWKFHDSSVTQILREINFGESRRSKSAIYAILGALNFVDLVNSIP